MSSPETQLQPFFLPSGKGKLFSVCFSPLKEAHHKRGILFFPPFAEEMNKSRRIVAEQARAFVALGYTVLVVDWLGTGDSSGDFGDADWQIWTSDVEHAIRWMHNEGIEGIYFWGMRLGALLALDCARQHADALNGILLWQPVNKGAIFLTQFLRLRLAADLVAAGEKITTKALRAQLKDGQSVEVAGYELSPELAADIDRLDLNELLSGYQGKLLWLELLAAEDRPVPAATSNIINTWHNEGRDISFHKVVCEPFWSLPELVIAPALIASSTSAFQNTFQ